MEAPVNTLGIRRVMFAVDDIDAVVAHMRAHGAELIGEMQYEDTYRLAYIRGPEGIIVALAEQLGQGTPASRCSAVITAIAPLRHILSSLSTISRPRRHSSSNRPWNMSVNEVFSERGRRFCIRSTCAEVVTGDRWHQHIGSAIFVAGS